MVEVPPGAEQAMSYIQHQAGKGLDSLAGLMQRTSADWQRCVEGMSDAQAEFKPAGEWSAKEVIGHLISASESVNSQIAAVAQGRVPNDLSAADPPMEGARPYGALPLRGLRGGLSRLFDETVALVKSLPEGDYLQTKFKHPFFGDLDIKEWVAFQRIHSMDHMGQIDKGKADPAYPPA